MLVENALADAGIDVKGNVCPGATISILMEKATELFTPTYQPEKILIHAGGIDSLRARAPKVVNDYKRLIGLIRALCLHSKIILSKLPFKDYHGKNLQRVREGLNSKGRPITFVPGDRLRVDNINHSLLCMSKAQPNIDYINFLPLDNHSNFSARDGLHFSRVGRDTFIQNIVAYFKDGTVQPEPEPEVSDHDMSFMSDASSYHA